MSLATHLRRQFEYEFWANAEEVRVLTESSNPPVAALHLLGHVIAAQMLWLDRLQNRPSRLPVWPDLTLANCTARLRESEAGWRLYLGELSDEVLASSCHYANSKGEVWENRVLDVLTHLLLHSAYHRGQIALEVRRSGQTPAYTDYIHAARQRFVL